MKSEKFAVAVAGFCVAASCALAGGNSVGYQIDSAHDGRVTFRNGFTTPLKQKWVVDLGGPVSYPVVANGMVFVTVGSTGQLWDPVVCTGSQDRSNRLAEIHQRHLLLVESRL